MWFFFKYAQRKKSFCTIIHTCSGPWKPGSRCCLSEAHSWVEKTPGGRENGMGREWGGEGKGGGVSLRATWGQGGQDHITPKEGFQVSKREWKGKLTGNQQGE
jgi:hypothetical protein